MVFLTNPRWKFLYRLSGLTLCYIIVDCSHFSNKVCYNSFWPRSKIYQDAQRLRIAGFKIRQNYVKVAGKSSASTRDGGVMTSQCACDVSNAVKLSSRQRICYTKHIKFLLSGIRPCNSSPPAFQLTQVKPLCFKYFTLHGSAVF